MDNQTGLCTPSRWHATQKGILGDPPDGEGLVIVRIVAVPPLFQERGHDDRSGLVFADPLTISFKMPSPLPVTHID